MKRHPPPPAPQTFAAVAPAANARAISESIAGALAAGGARVLDYTIERDGLTRG